MTLGLPALAGLLGGHHLAQLAAGAIDHAFALGQQAQHLVAVAGGLGHLHLDLGTVHFQLRARGLQCAQVAPDAPHDAAVLVDPGMDVPDGRHVYLARDTGSAIMLPTARPRDLPRLRELLFDIPMEPVVEDDPYAEPDPPSATPSAAAGDQERGER